VLIRHTLAYLPAQLIGPLVQFATAIVLTHYLGAADYGLTMLIFASQELVFLLCVSWWTIYMMRYAGTITDEAGRQRYASTETSVLIGTAALQVIATIGVILIAEPTVSPAFYASACVFTITRSFTNFLSERTRKNAAILEYSLLQIAAPLGGLLATLLVMVTLGARPAWVLLVFGITQGLVGLGIALRLGLVRHPGPLDRSIVRAAFMFGAPVVISGGLAWLAANGIRFVVQGSLGAVALGLVSVGWGFATRLAAVAAMVVAAAAYPLAVRAMEAGDPEGAKKQLSDNSALLLGIIAPATFGVIAINEPLTQLLIAQEYQATTISILPWALAGASIRNLRMHGWDQMYLLFEAPRPMLVLEASEAVATLLGAGIGIYMNGILGAVIGTTLAAGLVATGDFLFLRARFGLHAPIWQFLRILVASWGMYFALASLPVFGALIRPLWSSISLAIALGAFLYALMITALFPEFVRLAIRKLRERRNRGAKA
jgi:O-antigen/teichoic acid export membrane protein